MKRFVLIGFVGLLVSGCAFIKPTTELSVNPLTRTIVFRDSKDNDVSVEYIGYTPETKRFEVKNVVVRNNASIPITANVAQMEAYAHQQEMATQGILAATEGVAKIVNAAGDSAALITGRLGDAVSQLAKTVGKLEARLTVNQVGSGSVEIGQETTTNPLGTPPEEKNAGPVLPGGT